jgi:uncharacterized protein YeaO (DUF488 family)
MARVKASNVEISRVYEHPPATRERVLVDRLWPRGIAKQGAPIDIWLKDVAPTTGLRKWYGHQPQRFDEFAKRYRHELSEGDAAAALTRLRAEAQNKAVTLVTATRDVERSGAAVLRDVVLGR